MFFFTLRLLYLLLHVIQILCRTGVFVIQSPPVTLDAGATEKVYQVSFTSGISFQTTASTNVLNIIPVVGNTLLSGAFFSFSYQTYHSQFVSFDFIVSMYGNKIEKKTTSRTLERTSGWFWWRPKQWLENSIGRNLATNFLFKRNIQELWITM